MSLSKKETKTPTPFFSRSKVLSKSAKKTRYVLCFDTETTGVSSERYFNDKRVKAEDWPRIIQLGFIIYDLETMQIVNVFDQLIRMKPGFPGVPPETTAVHHITDQMLETRGIPIEAALLEFSRHYKECDLVVGHNVRFDINMICAEFTLLLRNSEMGLSPQERSDIKKVMSDLMYDNDKSYCTLSNSISLCRLPKLEYAGSRRPLLDVYGLEVINSTMKQGKRQFRGPRLENAHEVIFKQRANGDKHQAITDVAICLRIFVKIYSGVDICDAEHKEQNKFIFDKIVPEKMSGTELMVQVPNVDEIRQMSAYNLNPISNLDTRKRKRSLSKLSNKRLTKSLSLPRRTTIRSKSRKIQSL